MTYSLYIGDYAYSSWSLRGWLLTQLSKTDIRLHMVPFADRDVAQQLSPLGTARTVPTLITEDGAVISESVAIAEELDSRQPFSGIWPIDPKARATARTLVAEMATGFMALRSNCPMNLRKCYSSYIPCSAVQSDLARLETIWADARSKASTPGPWLLGNYSAADAFFAPVAARIAGYSLPVGPQAQAYVEAHLEDVHFRQWRALGLVHGPDLEWYRRDYDTKEWPVSHPTARVLEGSQQSINDLCPYSGMPVEHFLEYDGTVYGFCNALCRDKTAVDPTAWPDFIEMTREY